MGLARAHTDARGRQQFFYYILIHATCTHIQHNGLYKSLHTIFRLFHSLTVRRLGCSLTNNWLGIRLGLVVALSLARIDLVAAKELLFGQGKRE